jgi:hypothetical protein
MTLRCRGRRTGGGWVRRIGGFEGGRTSHCRRGGPRSGGFQGRAAPAKLWPTGMALGELCCTGVGGVTGPRSQGRSVCFHRRLSTGPWGTLARICPVAAEAPGVPAHEYWLTLDIHRSVPVIAGSLWTSTGSLWTSNGDHWLTLYIHWLTLDIHRSSSSNCDARYGGYTLLC